MKKVAYDLEERLLEYTTFICQNNPLSFAFRQLSLQVRSRINVKSGDAGF